MVDADSADHARSYVETVSVGGVAGGGSAISLSQAHSNTDAQVNGRVITDGNLTVNATSKAETDADISGGSGGIVAGVMSATVTSNAVGATRAFLGDSARIDEAATVSLDATSLGAVADSDVVIGSGAIVAVGVSLSEAKSAPVVSSHIAGGAQIG